MTISVGEEVLFLVMKHSLSTLPEREYRFAAPRRWRFDFAWPRLMLALEVEGRGRHQSFGGFEKDIEKYNEATVRGWRVLRFTPQMVSRDPDAIIATLVRAGCEERRPRCH